MNACERRSLKFFMFSPLARNLANEAVETTEAVVSSSIALSSGQQRLRPHESMSKVFVASLG